MTHSIGISSAFALALAVWLAAGVALAGEHAGQEHGGKAHSEEEQGGGDAGSPKVSAADIKSAINAHIARREEENDGLFLIRDPVSGKTLVLEFVKIHDPVRKIEGKGYFACTDFKPHGDTQGKLYDLDFWLDVEDGSLVVSEERIHKHPEQQDGKWVKKARYTFVDDEVVEIP